VCKASFSFSPAKCAACTSKIRARLRRKRPKRPKSFRRVDLWSLSLLRSLAQASIWTSRSTTERALLVLQRAAAGIIAPQRATSHNTATIQRFHACERSDAPHTYEGKKVGPHVPVHRVRISIPLALPRVRALLRQPFAPPRRRSPTRRRRRRDRAHRREDTRARGLAASSARRR
jgi:hypothetical protein